jgi:uncharacterized membrane protein YcaP (DUF421 family)
VDIVLRATFAYLFVFLLTRIVGRRELSTLQPFDLILLVMLGDLVQQGVTQNDFSVTGLVLAAGTVGVLNGDPVILLERGKPVERNLRRQRLTLEELAAEARLQSISSLDEVQWAVLETSGQISFVKADG